MLDHFNNCEGNHPAPLDDSCPFPPRRPPTTRRVTWQTRRTPSLSPPPPLKRGRGSRRGTCRGCKTAHQRNQIPSSPYAAHNQPDPPQTPDQPAPRDASLQPSVVIQPADQQAAAIQAIADQLARMQKEARDFQATAAKDREADRQEMLRRTATARPPTPGPSHQDPLQSTSRLPYPPADFGVPARRPPPYPTQGYGAHSQATRTQGHPAPSQSTRPTGPPGTTDLLPNGDETFQDHSLPCSLPPSGKSNSGGPDWTPSSYSKSRIPPQP